MTGQTYIYGSQRDDSSVISARPRKRFEIGIELPVFLLTTARSLSGVATYNILLYRTCVHHLDNSKEKCSGFLLADSSEDIEDLEAEVQQYVTTITMVRMIIEAILPAILSLFVGVWSGVHGRKPLVVWPLTGLAISAALITAYSWLDNIGPWWLLMAALPSSLFGGYSILITGVYCYVSDISTTERRSIRMTLLDATLAAGVMAGSIGSSSLVRSVGNTYLLLVVTGLYVLALICTVAYIRESLPGATKGTLMSLFKFDHVKEMVVDFLKHRENNLRKQILLVATASTLASFILAGHSNLDYLYSRRKLGWALSDYNLYSGLNTLMSFVGGVIGVICLQIILGIEDVIMVIIALVSAVSDNLARGFAVATWHMYLGSAISLMKGLAPPLMRSYLSKIIPIEEIAKIFAILCVLDAFCPIVAPPVYTSLYNATLENFPGAIYMLSAGLNSISALLLGISFVTADFGYKVRGKKVYTVTGKKKHRKM